MEIALAYIKAINLDVHSNRCEVPESKRILATNLQAWDSKGLVNNYLRGGGSIILLGGHFQVRGITLEVTLINFMKLVQSNNKREWKLNVTASSRDFLKAHLHRSSLSPLHYSLVLAGGVPHAFGALTVYL